MKVEHTKQNESNAPFERLKSEYHVRLLKRREAIELHNVFNECGETGQPRLRHCNKDGSQVLLHDATHIEARADDIAPHVELTIYESHGEYWSITITAHNAHDLGRRLLCLADQCLGVSYNTFVKMDILTSALDELDWDAAVETGFRNDTIKAAGEAEKEGKP